MLFRLVDALADLAAEYLPITVMVFLLALGICGCVLLGGVK